MPLWQAVLYFGLHALLFRLCTYGGTPALIRMVLSPFQANVVRLTLPPAILFALAFGFYKRDGYPLSWSVIQRRFRLEPMQAADWGWALSALIVTFLSIGALTFTAVLLVRAIPAIAPPDFLPPWLIPGTGFDLPLFSSFIGASLKGNWIVVLLFAVMLFFNVAGVELWWRGYILPRQELIHGRRTRQFTACCGCFGI